MNTKLNTKFGRIAIAITLALIAIMGLTAGIALAQSGGPDAPTWVVMEVVAPSAPLRSQPTDLILTDTNVLGALPQGTILTGNLRFQADQNSETYIRLGSDGALRRSEVIKYAEERWVSLADVKVLTGMLAELPWVYQSSDGQTVTRTVTWHADVVISKTASWSVGPGVGGWNDYTINATQPISVTPDIPEGFVIQSATGVYTPSDTATIPAGTYKFPSGTGIIWIWAEDTRVPMQFSFTETYQIEPGQLPATGASDWWVAAVVIIHVVAFILIALLANGYRRSRAKEREWEQGLITSHLAQEVQPADPETDTQD